MEETIIKFISQVGIPAGIAVYVLVRLEKTIKDLENSIDKNTQVLSIVLFKLGLQKELNDLLKEDERNVSKVA